MDENEFRSTYHSLNETRCVFEKSILTLSCRCQHAEKFNLAEREGIRCRDRGALKWCAEFLTEIRTQARFALGFSEIVGNLLPHNKEIQLQKGALLGLNPELPNLPETPIEDIHSLIAHAIKQSGGELSDFPYHHLIRSIKQHPPRSRRKRRRDNEHK